jgi:hypothetical protein
MSSEAGRFKKGQSGNAGGRPSKSTDWKKAEKGLRDAIPRILLMPKADLQKVLTNNPSGIEMLAAKYVHEHPIECVNRFLGKVPDEIHQENSGSMVIRFDPATD